MYTFNFFYLGIQATVKFRSIGIQADLCTHSHYMCDSHISNAQSESNSHSKSDAVEVQSCNSKLDISDSMTSTLSSSAHESSSGSEYQPPRDKER